MEINADELPTGMHIIAYFFEDNTAAQYLI